jgi:hypothetical protein
VPHAIDLILNAATPQKLFPVAAEADAVFKKLQRQVHPDLNPTRQSEATAAFVRLQEFYKKLTGGPAKSTFVTRKGSYTVLKDVWKASGVRYRAVEGTEETWMAYVATPGAQGPFVEGHRHLSALNRLLEEQDSKAGTTLRYFLPRVLDQFKLGDGKVEARILSAEAPGTRWFPLSQWTSMDAHDIAWIARRSLVALDLVHKHGYLHGSPHLEAFIVEPVKHGLMLKDWQYAVRQGDPLQLIDPQAKSLYPSWSKEPAATRKAELDLIIFGGAFAQLSRSSGAPLWLQEFFQQLQKTPPAKAEWALAKLTALLDSHWKRAFHPMEYPR